MLTFCETHRNVKKKKKKAPLFPSSFIFGKKVLFLNLSAGNDVKIIHLES